MITPETLEKGIDSALKVSFVESYKKKDTNFKGASDPKKILTYTPWAKAVEEALRLDPDFTWGVKHPVQFIYGDPDEPTRITQSVEDPNRNYFTDGRTCWVETWCCMFGKRTEMTLPVMDNSNKAMPVIDMQEQDKNGNTIIRKGVTAMDVNKAIMRCLVKNLAIGYGLGISIYYGEEFNEDEKQNLLEMYINSINEAKDMNTLQAIYSDPRFLQVVGKGEAQIALKKRIDEINKTAKK